MSLQLLITLQCRISVKHLSKNNIGSVQKSCYQKQSSRIIWNTFTVDVSCCYRWENTLPPYLDFHKSHMKITNSETLKYIYHRHKTDSLQLQFTHKTTVLVSLENARAIIFVLHTDPNKSSKMNMYHKSTQKLSMVKVISHKNWMNNHYTTNSYTAE